jgi:choline dehydrogenase-like flavoprotein
VERRLIGGDPLIARQVAQLLSVFGSPVSAFLFGGRPSGFASWTADVQDEWLREWERSAIPVRRTAFQALRRLILSTFYASPAAQADIGSLGPMYARDAVFPWEGALPGEPSDAEPVKRVPLSAGSASSAHRLESDAWREANVVPRGVVQGSGFTGDVNVTADVCVVGSGAGGAVVAAKLAERGLDVVVLEEGGYYTAADFTEDEGDMVPRLYADAGARATDDLSLSILQGRSVGGGTTINWMIMLRTPDAVLDEWADEHGTEGMRGADLSRWYDVVERDVHARMVPDDAHAPHNRIILDGARALGWRARPAMINAKECVRAGFCGVGCRYGAKQSTLVTYIPRALAAGARLYSDARVEKIAVVERGGAAALKRVTATVLDRDTGRPRGTLTVSAPTVVLSAGAVGTPAILARSGMGGGGVGRYLRVHPTTAIVGRYGRQMYGAAGIPQSALCDEFLAAGNGYGFWLESPALLPALASVAVQGFGASHRAVMREFPRLSSLISLVRDGANRAHSSGSVRVDRRGRPHIAYRVAEADRQTLIDGITAAARLHFAAGAAEVMTLHSPSFTMKDASDVAEIARRPVGPNQIGLFTAHMNGTCRIGTNPRESGCTPDGQRHGVPGVYVVDGSLFPTAPGVNPQNTIMALGHHFAERIGR